MKNLLALISILTFCSCTVKAQQDPYFSHYKFNPQSFNAASIARKPRSFCINLVSHKQWNQFDDRTPINREPGQNPGSVINSDVAPVTHNVNFHGPVKVKGLWSSNWFLGGVIISDQISHFRSTILGLNSAYRFTLGRGTHLSVGASVRLEELALVNPNFIARQIPDPLIPGRSTSVNDRHPDMSISAYFHKRRFRFMHDNYVGLSIQHLPQNKFDLQTFDMNQKTHWYLNAGSRIPISPSLTLEPSMLVKKGVVMQVDIGSTVLYRSKYRMGLGFRQWKTTDAISALIGYTKNRVQVGYSYDFTMSRISTVSNGTHEIMISYCIPIKQYSHRNSRWL
jgi:type IX secretion system PorP/SprF family membrane protein